MATTIKPVAAAAASKFPMFEPEKIIETRLTAGLRQYHIQWRKLRFQSWEPEDKLLTHPTQAKFNKNLIDAYMLDADNYASTSRRTSSRDTTTKVSPIQMLENITSTVGNKVRYDGFFQYALKKCRGNIEQAILMVTAYKD